MNRKLTGKGLRVRDRMIQETARIIREQGFKQATVRAISERAGVNIASIRYYFGSKDELIGAAIDYLMNNFENIVHYLEKGDVAPEDRLFSFSEYPPRAVPLDFVFADGRTSEYVFHLHQFIA